MNRDEKAATIDRIAGELKDADAIFAVDYRGISVPQAAELRIRLREADASFRVVKNSLTERAADQAGVEGIKEMLEGPTALTFVRGDAALAAKALSDLARTTQVLDFKGGLMGGAALSADDIRSIARLPAREVLYGQLVGTIASPIGGLVRTLNALISGLAIQLKAVADQGLVGTEAPAAEETPAAEEPPAAEEVPAEPEAPDVQEAAEQPNSDPDAEPHEAPEPQPDQAEGEDTPSETDTPKED
ncbi:MAG: large subunit ribosomal protein [Solirubrobacteraceae bacterium]|jgi:large subunit ribosomal protein L10|nr:large subunit ribosomal protein [Solirubrobacteraceae bacterium]